MEEKEIMFTEMELEELTNQVDLEAVVDFLKEQSLYGGCNLFGIFIDGENINFGGQRLFKSVAAAKGVLNNVIGYMRYQMTKEDFLTCLGKEGLSVGWGDLFDSKDRKKVIDLLLDKGLIEIKEV